MPIEKGKVAVVLLGSQEFPRCSKNFGGSIAFYNSYKKIKDYFCDPSGMDLNQEDILDLFNSTESADGIDDKITKFLIQKKSSNAITDLIFFYTGHGGYSANTYLLAIHSSREENLSVSSITLKSLALTIGKYARDIRTFMILDCCFSGDAVPAFQSEEIVALKKQFDNDFPSKGITLLCSASKDLPSIIVKERSITMFAEGLEKALRSGSSSIDSQFLTLRQLQNLTFTYIKELNAGEYVRPEVHTPNQPAGDIADIPHFPNKGFNRKTYDPKSRRKAIELQIIGNNLSGACNLFLDFVNDFDVLKKYEVDIILIASECNSLENEHGTSQIDRSTYKEERKKLYEKILKIISDLMKSPVS